MEIHIIENGEVSVRFLDLPEIPLFSSLPGNYKIFCNIRRVGPPTDLVYTKYTIGTDENHHLIPAEYFEEACPAAVCSHEQGVRYLLESIRYMFTLPE